MPDRLEQLAVLMRRIPTRASQVLSLRALEGLSRDECARWYGITPEAFDLLLLRAARDLAAAAQGFESAALLDDSEENAQARALAGALASPAGPVPETGEAGLLRELSALAQPLQEALRAAERADEASPRRRRENLIRRLLVLAIILLTAYFYLHARTRS